MAKSQYTPVSSQDIETDKTIPWQSDAESRHHLLRRERILLVVVLATACISFALGLLLQPYLLSHQLLSGDLQSLRWSSALPNLVSRPTRFNGSFEFTGKFRGPPSPALDYEWDRFTQHKFIDGTASLIAVDKNDIARANKTSLDAWFNSTVEYPASAGGGYMATLEVFHQLHCLNMLRKAIHNDYYTHMRPQKNGSYTWKTITHLDHCVEIIRQFISCHADTGLITFHWVKDNPVPYPDFNTWRQCKDPEEVLAWSKAREVPIQAAVHKDQFQHIIEMPQAP